MIHSITTVRAALSEALQDTDEDAAVRAVAQALCIPEEAVRGVLEVEGA